MASRTVTREEAQRKKEQAAAFMERIGDSDRADEFDSMNVDQYAERRGLTLTNPNFRRNSCMAETKSDLQDRLDEVSLPSRFSDLRGSKVLECSSNTL